MLTGITVPLCPEDFRADHAMRRKPRSEYWACYGEGTLRALRTLKVPLVPPKEPGAFLLTWHFDFDGTTVSVKAGLDYSDYGPDPASWSGLDALFVQKWHPKRGATGAFTFPLFAAGFPLAVGAGHADTDEFLAVKLSSLRALREGRQIEEIFFNKFHFRTIGRENDARHYPNRRIFERALAGHPYARTGRQTSDAWLRNVAEHRWVLNLCGNGNSIDRKVVELCAIGTAIISDRGLEDLALPWGGTFSHGENIWFVDGPKDLPEAMRQLTGERWRNMVNASRRLFATSFDPIAVGNWYLFCATAIARRKLETAGTEVAL